MQLSQSHNQCMLGLIQTEDPILNICALNCYPAIGLKKKEEEEFPLEGLSRRTDKVQ